jgi:hypothetical protein
LTGGIRKGAKGEPPVAIFTAGAPQFDALLIFFFSSAGFLAYDTIPEEIYLSG